MKILLVHNIYQQAGGEDVVFDQELQLLERHGHQVVTYLRSNHELEQLSAMGQIGLVSRIISAEDSKQDIRKILREEKPDLVHAHNTFMMISPSIFEMCKQERVPVLQTLHNYRLLCPAATFFRDGHVCEECTKHGLMRSVTHGCYRESRAATAAVALMRLIPSAPCSTPSIAALRIRSVFSCASLPLYVSEIPADEAVLRALM